MSCRSHQSPQPHGHQQSLRESEIVIVVRGPAGRRRVVDPRRSHRGQLGQEGRRHFPADDGEIQSIVSDVPRHDFLVSTSRPREEGSTASQRASCFAPRPTPVRIVQILSFVRWIRRSGPSSQQGNKRFNDEKVPPLRCWLKRCACGRIDLLRIQRSGGRTSVGTLYYVVDGCTVRLFTYFHLRIIMVDRRSKCSYL